ncbi:GlsB/YeaQ/YmgE family stress response membrane protein [Ligilactobacillus cholophilus]|uniref:GlsB/YeaQ/YmgE family stress response membrane protein n=1 Tax=Ligilactobacillus cholophilus TaxID=3050131 RepID=UPI0025B0987E|nr:GlsB/YeaQ/YmgE family stress response membrane protein [Ligilactobacillus cholophilus]
MLHLIWVMIVGAVIGIIAGWITKRGGSMNWIINIVAGLLGSYLGESLLGSWGWTVAGIAVFPAIIGAVILVLVASAIIGLIKK